MRLRLEMPVPCLMEFKNASLCTLDSIETFGCPISACWLPPHHNLYVFILPPDPAILLCRRHRREHGTKYCATKCLNGFELIIYKQFTILF